LIADGGWVCTDEGRRFSRYLSSTDWRKIQRPYKGALRALVAVANPRDLAVKSAAIDVEGELGRARDGLGEALLSWLPDENGPRVTVEGDLRAASGGVGHFLSCLPRGGKRGRRASDLS